MKRSLSNIRKKRGRGRPKVGATPVMVRLLPAQTKSLDAWRNGQKDRPGRPEAIRRLLDRALAARVADRPHSKAAARKASQLAAREIEGLSDKSLPTAEQQRRKRRLTHGPKEFRDIRGDQPKTKG